MIAALLATLVVFRLPVGPSLHLIIEGAFGDRFGLSRTAVKATPLLLTGLAMVISWRSGIYNIGGEGQFILGGLAGAWVASFFHSDIAGGFVVFLRVVVLGACVLGGALWAWVAGWLYVRRGVAVVISTILLNFIAVQILGWAVSGPLQEAKHQVPLSEQIPESLMLPKLDRQMDVHAGVLVAIAAAVAVYVLLYRTKVGYRLRLVGDSPSVARANRVSVTRAQITAMLISGGMCGLAGGIEFTGMTGQLGSGFSQQWGFLGIPVALVAGLNPIAAIPSAVYFGALFAGSENLERFTDAGTTIVYVIQAVAVLALVVVRSISERRSSYVGSEQEEPDIDLSATPQVGLPKGDRA